eukprot:4821903-Alexandrium_andersonii.AAC.1
MGAKRSASEAAGEAGGGDDEAAKRVKLAKKMAEGAGKGKEKDAAVGQLLTVLLQLSIANAA